MRTIKELLQILLNEIKSKNSLLSGLCFEITILYWSGKIDINERMLLDKYIKSHRGNHYYKSDTSFFWKPGNLTPRIKFLEKLIANETKKESL